jgi:hypothetical protein
MGVTLLPLKLVGRIKIACAGKCFLHCKRIRVCHRIMPLPNTKRQCPVSPIQQHHQRYRPLGANEITVQVEHPYGENMKSEMFQNLKKL